MSKKNKKKLISLLLTFILVIGFYLYDSFFNDNIDNNAIDDESTSLKRVISDNVNTSIDNLEIYYLDVGQADSILIRYLDNNILIDAGNNEDGSKLVKYFSSLGITNFKYVIGTHAHEDHIGGMDDIINSFSIDKYLMPNAVSTSKTFEDVLDSLEDNNVDVEIPTIDSKFNVGELEFNVIYVGEDESDINNTSIVLRLTYKNTSYLFMGDATSKVEKLILDKDIKSDVLKVGHHGSQYSSTVNFLEVVKPVYAIIQCGVGNSYGHPRDITLEHLEDVNATIYRTDLDHTIKLISDGDNISFEKIETDTNGG